jgi:hypothetical protein
MSSTHIPTVDPAADRRLAEVATPEPFQSPLHDLLRPLQLAAAHSSSLIGSYHSVSAAPASLEIHKFLLLGQRGGDRPIRVGLFSGFESTESESVRALTNLLLQLKDSGSLTRDYALMAYPVVNVRGFSAHPQSLAEFESRFARDSVDPVIRYYQDEFRKWSFDGLIHIRTKPNTRHLSASVRSEVIASEVVEPALAAAAPAIKLDSQPVKVRASDRYARSADFAYGRFGPTAEVRPYPFEIELFLPGASAPDAYQDGLFIIVTEILRNYRSIVAHARHL